MRSGGRRLTAVIMAVALVVAACTSSDAGDSTTTSGPPADFDVRPGVESVTVTGAEPGAELTLIDAEGAERVTEITDEFGQAHFSYLPDEPIVVQTGTGAGLPTTDGDVLAPGEYTIRDDTTGAAESFEVLAVDDHPDASFYDDKDLTENCPDFETERKCYTYIETRDGVLLSATIWLPDPGLWGEGPYPTVLQYSGYAPSAPNDLPDQAGLIGNLLGYAVVGINMRGSGCSGGVFDVFNPAQWADGYDAVETVARQPWVLHNTVGMIGISYAGISQLYVASTQPPSLSAITPLSVIDDPLIQQWPGGIYNDGFTKQWLEARDEASAPGGENWTTERVAAGDEICETNQQLSNQNIDFDQSGAALEFAHPVMDARSIRDIIDQIEVPVFLTGAWQDEQTGARFATMLDGFDNAPVTRFTLFNGHHPDGLSPLAITRLWEFLELYVAEERPELPQLYRDLAPSLLEPEFGAPLGFEPDRFPGLDTYEEVLAAYEAEPPVRVLFGVGAGAEPGWQVAQYEATFDTWPPRDVDAREFFLGPDGALLAEPDGDGVVRYAHDAEAGSRTYTDEGAGAFQKTLVEFDWQPLEEGKVLSFVSEPFAEDTVLAAPGYVDLWIAPGAEDVNVEVNLMEVDPDGTEFHVQSGWLRLGHQGIDEDRSTEFFIEPTFSEDDFVELEPGELIEVRVPVYPFAHGFRAGSRLRLTIETPGGNTPLWTFDNPVYDGEVSHDVAFGTDHPSSLHLMQLDGIEIQGGFPPCPSLRGMVCRDFVEITNQPGELDGEEDGDG